MDPKTLGLDQLDIYEAVRAQQQSIVDKLLDADQTGLVIQAPPIIALDERDDLPILGYIAYTTNQRYGAGFNYFAVLVVVRLESNEVFAELLTTRNEAAGPYVPKPLDSDDDCSFVVRQFGVSAREQLPRLPWKQGTLLTTVLLLDTRSNRVLSTLRQSATLEQDPEVREYIARHKRRFYPRPISPSPSRAGATTALPSYAEQPESPANPEALGIALKPEPVVVDEPGAACLLRGSFRLAPLEREIVPRGEEGKRAIAAGWLGVRDPKVTAIIPITIVAIGGTTIGPYSMELRVPVYEPIPEDRQAGVTGWFNVDLRELELPATHETFTIWAFSGEHMAGPCTMSVIPPQMLE